MNEKVRTVKLTSTTSAVVRGDTFLGIVEKGDLSYGEREWYAFAPREMIGSIESKRKDAVARLSTN